MENVNFVLALLYCISIFKGISSRNFSDCGTCEAVVQGLQPLLTGNSSDPRISNALSVLCNKYELQETVVCDGIKKVYEPEIMYIVGQLIQTPVKLCGYMGKCGNKTTNTLYNTTWTVHIPPNKPTPRQYALPGKNSPKLRVVHISDLHIDLSYVEGSEAECNSPLCCRYFPQNGTVKRAAGHWGTLAICDMPIKTIENLFETLRDNFTFDAIYWTGDLPAHDVWNQTRTSNINIYKNLTNLFLKYFPGKKIYSAVGNHESVASDSFAQTNSTIPNNLKNGWLYNELADSWLNWLPKNTENSIRRFASYVTKPFPGFRILSINTQYCDKQNFWLLLNNVDPDGALNWLVEQLLQAEIAGDKVHIIGHIPPGDEYCLPTWSKNYYMIVNRFEDTIRGQFFGHSHADEFSVFYEGAKSSGRPTNFYSVAPAVTTQNRNPGFKIYDFDGNYSNSSHAILEIEAYSTNITEANIKGKPEWKLRYKMKEFYGIPALYPQNMSNLINKFIKSPDLMQKYVSNYYRHPQPNCNTNSICQYNKLCSMRKAYTYTSANLCDDLNKRSSGNSSWNNEERFGLSSLILLVLLVIL